MLEQDDFKIREQAETPTRPIRDIINEWSLWVMENLLRQALSPKPNKPKMDDIRISSTSYGDTEIKVQPWGRRYGNYSGALEEQFGDKEGD